MYEDSDGYLWIGTEEGLNRLDRYSLEFKHFKKDLNNPYALKSDTITTITGNNSGLLYIGTNNGMSIYDKETNVFFEVDFSDVLNSDNSLISVFSLCMCERGFLWIGTNKGLVKMDIITGDMLLYQSGDKASLILSNFVTAIHKDINNNLWIGTSLGLSCYNTTDKDVHYFKNNPEKPNSLSNNFVTSIFSDRRNRLWVGTYGGGLNLFNYEKSFFSKYTYEPAKETSIGNDFITFITEDGNGNIWVGTSKGVNRIDNDASLFKHYMHIAGNHNSLNDNTVWSIFEDDEEKIWIGTDGGINIYDPKLQKFEFITRQEGKSNTLPSNQIRSIYKDSYGFYWFGTFDAGVCRYNKSKNTFDIIANNQKQQLLPSNQVWSIIEDKNGNMWFGTMNGLARYDRKAEKIKVFQYDENNPNSLSNNVVYNIDKDSKGYLWVSTYKGLNRLDVNTLTFTRFLNDTSNLNTISNNRLFSVYEDKDGIYWFATMGGGLNRYNPKTNTMEVYTEQEGLANNIVYNILEDNSGNLWMSTNFGLSKFDKNSETFINYDIQDGIQSSEFNLGAAYKTKRGELIFGGMNGLNVFVPEHFVENKTIPPLSITTFKIFNKPLLKQFRDNDTIELSYYDNFFSFEFAAIEFINPDKIKYAYKLENLDKKWTYTDAGRRFAEYTNVPPGQYIFKLRATNSNGIWGEEEIGIYLIVKNVWWRMWWFRSLIVFFLLVLVSLIIFDRYQKIRKKHLWEKQKLNFERQLFELKQKALTLQMNPHFIFNTLNSIQYFILKNNTDQAVQFMGKLSQLMRLILTGTRELYVPIMDEIKIITHYLDLEKIRFSDKFEYSIHIDKNIDSDFLAIPPMLIQPFVENAILHGIMHKKEKGHIKISLFQVKDNIRCVIEDNGVGREVSAKLKKESGMGHASKGISIIIDRLNLFESKNLKQKRLIFEDVLNAEGGVCGTKVEILLPYIEL